MAASEKRTAWLPQRAWCLVRLLATAAVCLRYKAIYRSIPPNFLFILFYFLDDVRKAIFYFMLTTVLCFQIRYIIQATNVPQWNPAGNTEIKKEGGAGDGDGDDDDDDAEMFKVETFNVRWRSTQAAPCRPLHPCRFMWEVADIFNADIRSILMV